MLLSQLEGFMPDMGGGLWKLPCERQFQIIRMVYKRPELVFNAYLINKEYTLNLEWWYGLDLLALQCALHSVTPEGNPNDVLERLYL